MKKSTEQLAKELCESVITKVEKGQMKSIKTYAMCKALLEKIEERRSMENLRKRVKRAMKEKF